MWMIYGAYGFTGRLIAEEAVRRGHEPVLAGRSAKKLVPMAESMGLDYIVFDIKHLKMVAFVLREYELVLNCAGPYIHTAETMLRACALSGTNYLDLTGEIAVYEANYAYERAAQQNNFAVISGVGFDVVPSDCLACHLAGQLPNATHLDIAFQIDTRASAGTAKSAIDNGARGGWIRKNGALTPLPLGTGTQTVAFRTGEQLVMPIPWGDLSTAYHSTRIPNIVSSMAMPGWVPPLLRSTAPLGQVALSAKILRQALKWVANIAYRGPSINQQEHSLAQIWAQVRNEAGERVEAWMETPEPYRFTAISAVRAVEQVLDRDLAGVLTPSQAFGADFPLQMDGVQRFDRLD